MPSEKMRRRQQPGAQAAGKARKALDKSGHIDREKLEDNQRLLGVGTDHKSAGMKKGHRGTFP